MSSDHYWQDCDRPAYSYAAPQPEFRISLTLAISDLRALWTAAAARLLAVPGTTLDDVVEVIGPSEDPSARDCLAALTKPDILPGCDLDDFWIDQAPGDRERPPVGRLVQDHLPLAPERGRRMAPPRVEPALALPAKGETGPHHARVN